VINCPDGTTLNQFKYLLLRYDTAEKLFWIVYYIILYLIYSVVTFYRYCQHNMSVTKTLFVLRSARDPLVSLFALLAIFDI